MMQTKRYEFWFVTGSQHLYGEETLHQVEAHSRAMTESLNEKGKLPFNLVFKPVLTTPDDIRTLCVSANAAPECAGIIAWMHTFSPAKMWIAGLTSCKNRCSTCIRSLIATFRGNRSIWTL